MKTIIKRFERVAVVNIIFVFGLSVLILTGWQFYNSPIKNLFPGNQLSNPVTSLCFLLAGFSFLSLISNKKQFQALGKMLALIVLMLGLIKFSEVLFKYSSDIDKWLFTDKLALNSNEGRANFMAPNTAMTFFILGISLLLFRYKINKKNILADYFASAVGLISLASLIGFSYQAMEFYHAQKHIPMAFPTALSFFLMSTAILLRRSEFGFFSLFTTRYEGSRTARFLVPFAVIIPVTTGLLRLYGEQIGLFSSGMGVALFAVTNIVLFLFVIWRAVLSINTSGKALEAEIEERTRTEQKLIENQQLLKDLYDNAPIGYYSVDTSGNFVNANNTTLNWLGYTKEELIGKHITEILSPQSHYAFTDLFPILKEKGYVHDQELFYTRKDGSVFPALLNASAVKDQSGDFLYSRTIISDITERKKLEEEISQSNIFLDTILESIPHMIFVKDAKELRFERFNKAGEDLIGVSKNDMIGKNDYDLFSKEAADHFTETDREVLKKGVLHDIKEERINTVNGDRWLHTIKIPIKDNNGMPIYLLGVSEDITQRKKTEEALKESNEKFLRLFYASPLAMVIRNIEDGMILDVNEEYERLLGYKKEEIVGKTSVGMGMILDPGVSEMIPKNASGKRSLKNIEATLYNAKKEAINVIVSIENIRLGNKDCIISAILDITERKKLEENLDVINKELESFTYSVSHDLRAPLRIINGYAQMIKNESKTLAEEPQRMLENIILNAKHMGNLIDDLLNFSRLGRKELVTHNTDMNAIVQTILQQQVIGKTKYTISVANLPDCYCDSSLVKQVWGNLISNAIKYSANKPNPVIEIGSLKENDNTVYYIKDNGAGFDMKYYDKLFGVFQRLHKASEFEGTGVGLALSQRIISKHGGRIWAESKINEGSTFYFNICKS